MKFSSEHLFYELQMFHATGQLLEKTINEPLLKNCLIESFVIHSSTLIDFFYSGRKKNDAIADDFVISKIEWKKRRPKKTVLLNKAIDRRNTEMAHLSYDRSKVLKQSKAWDNKEIKKELLTVIDTFLSVADSSKLSDNVINKEWQ